MDGYEDDPVGAVLGPCLELPEEEQGAAIESARLAHPELGSEIDRRLGLLRSMGLLRADRANESFPERLGEFRLLERLGGGGMGVVYRALQEPLGREVALKLIRPELLYFPRARERFRRETLAVASLQHSGIVPIYTVGEAGGVPYFAMELLAGATLAEVLAALQGRSPESLTGADLQQAVAASSLARHGEVPSEAPDLFRGSWVEASLRCLLQVARALEHAHARGVLHRDVKPSNILLTPDGRARLIDFGLASSAVEARLSQTSSAIGSLPYMSPEQVRGEATLDARSDVYSLGASLYELLTLQLPFLGDSPLETSALILDGRADPIRARNRAVSRDAETVCLKALDRDPARRYASVTELARDLESLLALRPVVARPLGVALRVRRWAQRNPARATAVLLGAALVLGTPTGFYFQQRGHADALREKVRIAEAAEGRALEEKRIAQEALRQAEIEQRDAQQTADFLVEVLGASDPNLARGREVSARDLLDRGAERLARTAELPPEVRGRLAERLGLSYSNLGEYERARALLEQALELHRELYGEEHVVTAKTQFRLGSVLARANEGGAEELLAATLSIQLGLGEKGRKDTIETLGALANLSRKEGRFEEALGFCQQGLEAASLLAGDTREQRSGLGAFRAGILMDLGRAAEAEAGAREVVALCEDLYGERHPDLLGARNTLAVALQRQGRVNEAREILEQLLQDSGAVHGERSQQVALFSMNLALNQTVRGLIGDAERLTRDALEMFREILPEEHPDAVLCLSQHGVLLFRLKRWREARDELAQAVELAAASAVIHVPIFDAAYQYLGLAQLALGEDAAAETTLREALRRHLAHVGEGDKAWVLRGHLAAALLHDPDATEEAGALLEGALEAAADRPALAPSRGGFLYGLGQLALDRGDLEAAESLLREGSDAARGSGPAHWSAHACSSALGECLGRLECPEDAESPLAEGAAGLEQTLGPEHAETRRAWSRLAQFLESAGRGDEAAQARERADGPGAQLSNGR